MNDLSVPTVDTQHADYRKFAPQWKRCRDVVAGQDTIHAAGVIYLPRLRDQDALDYTAYVKRSPFYNATARTISGLVGMVFRKPPKKATPAGLDGYLKDIDLCGMPFDVFAQEVAEECLEVGRVGVLIDYPVTNNPENAISVAAAQAMNLRPTMKVYATENIINWKYKQINNAWTLCMLVLAECHSEPNGEFGETTEDRWRVLDLYEDNKYRVRLFHKNKTTGKDEQIGDDMFPLMNNNFLIFIPFVVMTPDGLSSGLEEPPLIDLVDTNLSHYRVSADYEHGCHFTALPTLFIAGYSVPIVDNQPAPEKIYLGSQAAITLPDTQANAKFIEFTGQGLSALERNLDRKEQQMAILGARMLAAEKKQAETATTTAIHRTGEASVLSAIAIAVSLGLGKALSIFADWAGAAGDIVYDLNRDFLPITVDGTTLTSYVQAWQSGAINKEEFFNLLQRGDIVEGDVTLEQHNSGEFEDPTAAPLALVEAKGKPGAPKPKI